MQRVACGASVAFQVSFFDPFALFQNYFVAPELDVSGCDLIDTIVIALVVVLIDKGSDLSFKITRQKVIFWQDAVLQCLIPTLNLALRLWMI